MQIHAVNNYGPVDKIRREQLLAELYALGRRYEEEAAVFREELLEIEKRHRPLLYIT